MAGTSGSVTEADWLACPSLKELLEPLGDRASERKLRLFACACCRQVWRLLIDDRSRHAVELAERFADGLVSQEERRQARQAAIQATILWQTWGANEVAANAAIAAVLAVSAANEPLELAVGGELNNLHHRLGPWFNPFSVVEDAADWCAEAVALETRSQRRAKALDGSPWWGRLWQRAKWSFLDTDFSPYVSDAQRAEHQVRAQYQAAARAAQAPLLRDILGNLVRAVPTIEPAWLRWHDDAVVHIAQSIYDGRRSRDLLILADALDEAGCTNADLLGHCREPGEHVRGCWVVDLVLGKN